VKKLKLVSRIVSQKSILPILTHVLIRAEGVEVALSTTNLDVSITTTCEATIETPGVIAVPVKSLLDVMSQISEGETHIFLDKSHVRIAAGAFKMRLQSMAAIEFPQLPIVPAGGMLLPGEAFKQMVKRVRYAISESDKRYFLNGALMTLTANTLALTTTDGKRVSLAVSTRDVAGPALEIIVPTKTLDVLLMDEAHEDLMFVMAEHQMFFVAEDNVLTSRMVDGLFPNVKRIIPLTNDNVADVPRAAMLSALKRVSLAAGDQRGIVLSLSANSASIAAANAQVGDASEHVTVGYSGPDLKIAFEWPFLSEFLSHASGANVTAAFGGPQTPALWSDGEEFVNVIMQMRT